MRLTKLLRSAWRMALGALVLSMLSSGARAEPLTASAVRAARQGLAEYDLEGRQTLNVIRRLGRFIAQGGSPADLREARFLRAMAAADLLVAARELGSDALAERVADAWGVPSNGLVGAVGQALDGLMLGAYAAPARHSRDALAILEAQASAAPIDWAQHHGLRRDVLLAATVRRSLGLDDATQRLAAMGADPCAEEEGCPDHYAGLGPQGRRVAWALMEARASVDRAAEAARQGEPLMRALAAELSSARAALEHAQVPVAPLLPTDATLLTVDESGAPFLGDMVIMVSAGRVQCAWTPRLTLSAEGTPAWAGTRTPALPETQAIRIPSQVSGPIKPVRRLTQVIERLRDGGSSVTAALAVAPDVEARVLVSVLKSVTEAGVSPTFLLGRHESGVAWGVPFQVVRASDEAPVQVRVRLGGYTLRTEAAEAEIPRVRDAEGNLRFDASSLAEQVAAVDGAAALSFMAGVDSGPVLSAAFGLGQRGGPLGLVVR